MLIAFPFTHSAGNIPTTVPTITLDLVLKLVGGVLALVGAFLTWKSHTDRATFDMIDKLYSLCHTLEAHALNEWNVSHLFCIGEAEYESVKERIMLAPVNDLERQGLIVKEKLFAIHIFICYEQVYYQLENTRFLKRRREFLSTVLSYFADRLIINNPRLIAFLQEDPKGETLHLEQGSAEELMRRVKQHASEITADTKGPFGADVRTSTKEGSLAGV